MWQFIDETRESCAISSVASGASVDWSRLRFTMDEGSAKAVRVAFKRLYDDGLAYRAEQLINWCPGCRTSVSDLEVIATPTGTLWSVRYHFVDATTARSTRTTRSPSRRPGRRRSSATPPSRSIRKTSATRRRRPPGADPVRRPDVPVIADDVVAPRLRHRRGQDHAGP